jgi:hypothetical protein
VITRTWTATDLAGNASTCVQLITFIDEAPPAIICPVNAAIPEGAAPDPALTGHAQATDNCTPANQIALNFSDQTSGTGCNQVITRTWTATDLAGNASTCVQLITFIDEAPPAIICPVNAAIPEGAAPDPALTGHAQATDNCTPANQIALNFSDQTSGTGCNQVITRTWTATDLAGNASTCVQLITFIDEAPPVIICPVNAAIPEGAAPDPALTGHAQATDNCTPANQIALNFSDQTSGTGCNQVITRTWTATDLAGNASTCVQLITFIDEQAPVITCPADITQFPCSASPTPNDTGFPAVSDNCTPSNQIAVAFSDQSSGPGCVEALTRTWTATDLAGNASTCIQSITIVDLEPPVIACPVDASVVCGDEFDLTVTGLPEAFDLCSPDVSLDFSDDLSGYANCEGVIIRTWIAVDGCGNASTCQQQVVVAPIPCDITASLSVTPSPCGAAEGSISVEISPPGTYTVMWSNGLSGAAITGLSPGLYEATITEAGTNCVLVVEAEVPETPAYFLELVEFTPPSSPDAADGAVVLAVNPPSVILPMVVIVNGVFYGLENSPIFTVFGLTAGLHTFMIIDNEGNGCPSTELTVELFPQVDKPQTSLQWFPFNMIHPLPSRPGSAEEWPQRLPQLPEHPLLEAVAPALYQLRGMPVGISLGATLSSRLQITGQLQQYRGEAVHTLRAAGAPQTAPFVLHQPFTGWDGRLGLRLFSRPEATGWYLGLEGQWQRLAYRAAFLAGSPSAVPLMAKGSEDAWGLGMTAGLRLPAGRQAFLDLNLRLSPFAWGHPQLLELSPALGLGLPLR